jgi:hypothetical protein
MKRVAILLMFVAAIAAAIFWYTRRSVAPPISANEVQALFRESVPASVDDAAWKMAPVHDAQLLLQDIVDPRLLKPSTGRVKVQSVTNGREIAFLMRWDDATTNDSPAPASFPDACAIQLPSTSSADLPAPQMGEEGRTVEITYWSAIWQAGMTKKHDDIKTLHPNSAVDHYPFQAEPLSNNPAEQQAMEQRYAPARAVRNPMSGPRNQPVQDLIAEGPGTLAPAAKSTSRGTGNRLQQGWEVVIVRQLPEGLRSVPRSQVAFAVWEGSKQEVGARKMRTAWIPLSMEMQK